MNEAVAEYRQLELDSSNDMMDADSRRALGRYVEAAWHHLQAGAARERMGQMMFDTGDRVRAAADWLSAAACFHLATNLQQMSEVLNRVHELVQQGSIPPERRDIRCALVERDEQQHALEHRMARFQHEYEEVRNNIDGQEFLTWLLGQVRDLPGFMNLQLAVAHRAMRLGQFPLALQHLKWAERLAPGSTDLKALRVALLLTQGDRTAGLQLGFELLREQPQMAPVRLLLVGTLAFKPSASRGDWERALELLRPLCHARGDWMDRLVPLALAVTLHQGLEHDDEYQQSLDEFNRLAESVTDPTGRTSIAALRGELPNVFLSRGAASPVRTTPAPWASARDLSTMRGVFEKLIPLSGTAA
ncbi:hypothetical protein R5W23_002094 [Gemmata sp. JC673]|uniref:Tetratricopeptide repeat protein n=1 Tax=Gemmata algarum TaxID=2975278 RepID=A0ABU5EZV3_9BACT|nr:hypothetical protein [Gemmata algarum]MDY3560845.1 hypothetical protein [Gemmata algarum]